MKSRQVGTFMLRQLFAKSSFQRSVSTFTKLDNHPAVGILHSTCCNRYCSILPRNSTENIEESEMKPTLYADADKEAITDNDPKKLAVFEMLLTKVRTRHEKGQRFPKYVSVRQWREIVSLPSVSQQMKYFKFLSITEVRKQEQRMQKLEKRKQYEEFLEERKKHPKQIKTTSSPPAYGLSDTTMFQRIRDTRIEKFYNYKLLDAMMYGPDIVFDCEYTSFMTRREINSAAFQVAGAWRMNRSNMKPFHVVYTNLAKGSVLYDRIKLSSPLLDEDPAYPFTYTPKSFMDLYPKDRLIYLSPHAVETMETYEPDKVYVIGCMVDLTMPEPLSLAKAEKFGIRTVKFPLDKYLNWKCGGKALNMDHCIKIMLDIKNGLDWQTTLLKHIPSRKLEIVQPDEPKEYKSHLLNALAIRRMYMKNKVHEIILNEDRKEKPS